MTCQVESESCTWNDPLHPIKDGNGSHGTEAPLASTATTLTDAEPTTASDSISTSSDISSNTDTGPPGKTEALSPPTAPAPATDNDAAAWATSAPSGDTQPDPLPTATTVVEDADAMVAAVASSDDASGVADDAVVPAPPAAGKARAASPSPKAVGSAGTDSASPGLESNAQLEGAVAPADPVAAGEPEAAAVAAVAVTADSPLDELRSLLQLARLAVARLEVEVTRQERRLAALANAATAVAAVTVGGAAVATADPAVAAATAAALRSLGVDASGASAAARQALRSALQQVLQERGLAAGGAGMGSGAGARSGAGAGVAEGDWFGRHFEVRSAARLAPPAAAAVASSSAVEADGAAPSEPGSVPAVPAAAPAAVVTCAFPYELPHPDAAASGGGALQYIVAGDATGTLYILRPADAAVMAAVPTGTDSPVTACSAFFVRRYESTIVTGHANGQTRSFGVLLQDAEAVAAAAPAAEAAPPAAPTTGGGEPAAATAAPPAPQQPSRHRQRQQRHREKRVAPTQLVVHSVRLRHVVDSMPPGALPWAAVEELPMSLGDAAATAAAAAAAAGAPAAPGAGGESEYKGPPAPIMHILPYRLGHKPTGRRHLLVVDRAGNLRLERENGTLRFWARTNRTQMAVRFVGTHVVMLSAFHATLVNTLQPRPPRAYPCHNLNGTRLVAASFDGHRSFRGYGISGRGELVSLVTPHEGGLTTCKVHRATSLPWLVPELLSDPGAGGRHSLTLTPLRGYLLLTHGSGRVLFNVTGVVRNGIPTLTSVADDMIAEVAGAVAPTATSAAAGTDADAAGEAPPAAAFPTPLIGGMLPAPPVVAVAPGSQVIVMALPPTPPSTSPPLAANAAEAATQGGSSGGGDGLAAGGSGSGLGGRAPLLVVLDSRMPRPPVSGSASKIWSQPVFVAAMLLVGLYQFWRMSNARMKHRNGPAASRNIRARRGPYGAGYGGNSYGDAAEYMYGEGRMPPMQPRSALRRGRSDRPMGRTVTYEDDDY